MSACNTGMAPRGRSLRALYVQKWGRRSSEMRGSQNEAGSYGESFKKIDNKLILLEQK